MRDFDAALAEVASEDQAHQAEQSEQARRRSQYTLGRPVARRGEAQMRPHFLEGHFDAPTAGEEADDLIRTQGGIGRIKVLVAMGALHIVDENPADRHQSPTGLVPVTGVADEFDAS